MSRHYFLSSLSYQYDVCLALRDETGYPMWIEKEKNESKFFLLLHDNVQSKKKKKVQQKYLQREQKV